MANRVKTTVTIPWTSDTGEELTIRCVLHGRGPEGVEADVLAVLDGKTERPDLLDGACAGCPANPEGQP